MLLTLLLLRPVSQHQLSVLLRWRSASVFCEPCCTLGGYRSRMAPQIMYCNVLFRSLMWTHTMVDRFRRKFNKDTLVYILIIYPFTSKHIVPQCFDRLCRRLSLRLGESHHIGVCFCDFIVHHVRLKQMADSLTVRTYWALLLTLMRLRVQSDACIEFSRSREPHK